MPNYRRNRVPGGTYFFTVTLHDRRATLLTTHIAVLREAVRFTRQSRPFYIDAWVVLPDHTHCIWTLPPGDKDYSGRWRALKIAFSKAVPPGELRSAVMKRRNERGIWQRRFWEHTIRDADDYANHMDYVHLNPVKHGYVSQPGEWAFSSFHRAVRAGVYSGDWAGPCGLADNARAHPPYDVA